MSRHFAALAYTPSVQASQRRYDGAELDVGRGNPAPELGFAEAAFIAARDSFYLATISETGWPHVQHRGGQAGFLSVLDTTTLAFADFSGNRQYVSVGNLAANDRVALILVDYPNRRRLKILGHVEIIDIAAADAALLARIQLPKTALAADIERILVIRIAAFDWNCSRHITPRYTESEWETRHSSATTAASTTKE